VIRNEGLVVFIYDGSHAGRIRESGAELLEGFNERAVQDRRLFQLGAEGLLLVYELQQDDDVEIEVLVGADLDSDERSKLADHERSDPGWLYAPSGRIFIDTYNTLRAIPEAPDARGATVTVESGHYSVWLHRIPLSAVEATRYPQDVLVLRPLARRPRGKRRFWWPAPTLGAAAAAPPTPKAGAVVGRGYAGRILFLAEGEYVLNIDPDTGTLLGLRPGTRLLVEVTDEGLELEAIYMGADVRELREATPLAERRQAQVDELAQAHWASGTDFEGTLLLCSRVCRGAKVPNSLHGRWVACRVSCAGP
jgi:hypothetical protein